MNDTHEVLGLIDAIPSAFLGHAIMRRIGQKGLLTTDTPGRRVRWEKGSADIVGAELKDILRTIFAR
jgi:hypothetical protein